MSSLNHALRRRFLALALVLLVAGPSIWLWRRIPADNKSTSPHSPSAGDAEGSISVSQLLALGSAEVAAAQSAYVSSGQAKRDEAELGLGLGRGRQISQEGYEEAIQASLARYFDPSPSWTETTLAHLSPLAAARAPLAKGITKEIYTTSYTTELPTQFKGWSEQNPDWKVRFLDDAALEAWVRRSFPDSDLQREWELLSEMKGMTKKERKVLKADLFRYLVLLDRGGVYTDSDTASVRPIEQWGTHNAVTLTSPLQSFLPALLSLVSSKPASEAHLSSGSLDTPPALVVALEADAPRAGDVDSWRGQTFSRGMQVVQWTLRAEAGHPVMLDAVGRALDQLRALREGGKAAKASVLDLTGPGLFTDCVFRYLLARYGVTPRELSGRDTPVRVGDVLVLPHRAMQADISEHASGEQDVVWHGFTGRWKEDD